MAISYRDALNNADLEYKLENGQRIIRLVNENASKLNFLNYCLLEESNNLLNLLDIYTNMQPFWINVHNQVQDKKPEKIR